jgi:ELWxxDGT repeat protein
MKRTVAWLLMCLGGGCGFTEARHSSEASPPQRVLAEQSRVPPVLVRDLNLRGAGSTPSSFVDHNGFVYFGAGGPRGPALYRTQGVPGDVRLVKSFPQATGRPAPLASYRTPLGNRDGVLVLKVPLPGVGSELWVSDGTDLGTVLLKELNPGVLSGDPLAVGVARGLLFFTAMRGGDRVLWQTDGTATGTQLVTHHPVGREQVIFRDQVVFVSGPGNDTELWISNGSPGGTRRLKDLHPAGSASPGGLAVAGDTLFFFANDGAHGVELWKTDGTEAGTALVKDVKPGSGSATPSFGIDQRIAARGGEVFFAADDGVHGLELWKTDGTEPGTVLVKDALPGSAGSSPLRPRASGDKVFFLARLPTTGYEPWVSDGTAAGTDLLRDIRPGEAQPELLPFHPYGQGVVFVSDDGVHGRELWSSNGTPKGTSMVTELFSGPGATLEQGQLWLTGGRIYFSAATDLGGGEPALSDGTAAGTRVIQDLNSATESSAPSGFAASGSQLFFSADDGKTGRELYVTDGTDSGTQRLTDVDPGPRDGVRGLPIALGGSVFFPGHTPREGTELWVTHGKSLSTSLVRDINPTPGQGGLDSLPQTGFGAALGGSLYFAANDGQAGLELWRSDGTPRGTYRVTDVFPGPASGVLLTPPPFTFGEALYFTGQTGPARCALYRITEKEDVPVRLTPEGVYATRWAVYQGKLFFLGSGVMGGPPVPSGLWSTEGTLESTQHRVSGSFRDLVVVGSELVLVGDGAMFASNGTQAGTRLFALTSPGAFSQPVSFGGKLAFVGGNGALGFGLWSSELTRAGTRRLTTAEPAQSSPLMQVGDRLYFANAEGKYGNELWQSDLSVEGTTLALDINPGPQGSNPQGLFPLDAQRTLMVADDGTHGAELWLIPGGGTP